MWAMMVASSSSPPTRRLRLKTMPASEMIAISQVPAGGRGAVNWPEEEESVFGVGRNAFQEFDFLQHAAGALGDGAHRVVSEMHR